MKSLLKFNQLALSTSVFCAFIFLTGYATAAGDANKGAQIATQVCAACHGPDGNATAVANPKLAAQHEDYLYKQLTNFKVKQGAKEAERANAIMAGFAAQLSPADMRNVAAYYKELTDLGRKIYRGGIAEKGVPACAGCHGAAGAGIPAQYARLGGQWAEYTESQLMAFRSGLRKNNAQMTTISSRLSDLEMKAVADYIAGLRVAK
jgi:cytochrome c553